MLFCKFVNLSFQQSSDEITRNNCGFGEIISDTVPKTKLVTDWHPITVATRVDATNSQTWYEVMNGPDAEGYKKACNLELNTLANQMDAWEVMQKEIWMQVIRSTRAFCCKCYPDGTVKKLKAHFCDVGTGKWKGGLQQRFAPVISWTTMHLMLILSIILNLQSVQVDYTATFIHVPID